MPPEPKPTANAKSSAGAKSALGGNDSGEKKSNSELALKECDEIEEELAALRVTYEQYFLGNERFPPVRAHEDLKKRLIRLKGGLVRNTAAKFRMNSLHTKFLTYERLWQRTLMEIESGTYKRDLFKAKRRAQKSTGEGKRKGAIELEELGDDDLMEVEDIVPNEPVPVKPAARGGFVPQPVDDTPTFRPVAATPVPVIPTVPVVPTVAPAVSGTPFRGTAAVPSVPSVPSVPTVSPMAGTPARGTSAPPPSKAAPTIPPGGTPAKGVPTIPPGGTPAKGVPTIPPGGTPARGSPSVAGTPARGVPSFGAPSQSTSGIAAALESLTDEPLTPARPTSSAPSRPGAPAAARPGTAPGATSGISKPGVSGVSKPAAPAATASRPPPSSGSSGGLSDDKLKQVYDAYVTAKRRNQEDTSKMSYETVAANLRKQVPELLKQHNAKSVEFKVVIKDGKATLKAVPK
ncbi:MXAN_5187 C-terminal domain-containing protein [Hyalangium rubrum]|uniref:MXAN_5187 C-terminal domain-containing protein n=1 Tax=Hyalangium rubrum TaxID=3103134 RepID=A0ABU5GYA2_9BACT|nr:MXAN_5187 C-terminal domain-containing protein [Hyalangium sp. s54d21]MDY7226175.1 MXAN_5187 C-terminal domain-containing protein [Hyalangium sp. s54d21]